MIIESLAEGERTEAFFIKENGTRSRDELIIESSGACCCDQNDQSNGGNSRAWEWWTPSETGYH